MGTITRWQPLERRPPLRITGFSVALVAADLAAAYRRLDVTDLGLIVLRVGAHVSRARC